MFVVLVGLRILETFDFKFPKRNAPNWSSALQTPQMLCAELEFGVTPSQAECAELEFGATKPPNAMRRIGVRRYKKTKCYAPNWSSAVQITQMLCAELESAVQITH